MQQYEKYAINLRKNDLVEIEGKWYQAIDIRNDKLGGPHKNVHMHARSIHDNAKIRRDFYDYDCVQLMAVKQRDDIQWVGKKDDTEVFALDEDGHELIIDATVEVDETNVVFISNNGHLLALNSKFIPQDKPINF